MRCAYPDCNGFIAPTERAPYMEYCMDLKNKAYEYELDSLVDYDTELLEMRKLCEWSYNQPIPTNLQSVNWRKKPVHMLRCAFCQRANHTHHTCSFKMSEEEIPPPKDSSDRICYHYNAGEACPQGEDCPLEHKCMLCKSATNKHQVFRCKKILHMVAKKRGNNFSSKKQRGRGRGKGRGRGGKPKPAKAD